MTGVLDAHLGSRLSAFIDGELPEPVADRLREHLCRCTACAMAVAQERRVRDSIRMASTPEPRQELVAMLRAALPASMSAGSISGSISGAPFQGGLIGPLPSRLTPVPVFAELGTPRRRGWRPSGAVMFVASTTLMGVAALSMAALASAPTAAPSGGISTSTARPADIRPMGAAIRGTQSVYPPVPRVTAGASTVLFGVFQRP